MIKTKTLIFFLIILVTSFYFSKSRTNKIDFNDVLDNQNKTDSDKIIDLQKQLSKHRKRLVECKQDKNSPPETYENVLDFCGKLEYAIKEIERFKK